MRAVLEQRKLRGYDNKMPLDDPEIRRKVFGDPLPVQVPNPMTKAEEQHINQRLML